ncbi:CPBP family intramembrane glutamic endopeptidase [Edaphobacter bradus]|uniref:CPBP family intramembrane glutamic endopeptidase n=1 Tax=Edaphobacter bradus TaxID=2259016 RepID=UPI0021E0F400|nr:CPBP family glutamic-type intramembrane protease [Edaphobacter bradus]
MIDRFPTRTADASQPQAPPVDSPQALNPTGGKAIVIEAPPPSVAPGPGVPARVPHIGHALLFVLFAAVVLFFTEAAILAFSHPAARDPHKSITALINPKLIVGSEAFTYIATLLFSWAVFPLLWHRSFADGLRWDLPAALRNVLKLVPLGIVLSVTVQAISSLLPVPKSIPMDDFFRSASDVWLVTAFGIFLAPMFEEVCFRGFFLPAFAIAYDWLSLPRSPAAHERWRITTSLTAPAIVFSTVVTSILFTALHGQQVGFAWPVLILLFCVSLILTLVRLRTQSVACSTLVHAGYNLTIFLHLFIGTGGYRHLERMTN